jgi:hypothetical protein
MKPTRARVAAIGGVLVAGVMVLPAAADSNGLHAASFGVVDFGDAVDFRFGGGGCAGERVHVEVAVGGHVVQGPAAAGCAGVARVPSFDAVRATGWRQGDPIAVQLRSHKHLVPLRYQRVELDRAAVAAGAPTVVKEGDDPDTGPHDAVLAMSTGDVVDLGRVNVEGVDSISLRLCLVETPRVPMPSAIIPSSYDVPVRMSLHQDAPDGRALMHEVDVSANPTTTMRLQNFGFGDSCWRLGTFEVTGVPVEAAPRLFLKADLALPGTLTVNSIDFNGTGARSAAAPNWAAPDPAGMKTIFNGSSFDGWAQTGCALRDRAATNLRTRERTSTADCAMTHETSATNRVVRLELRRRNFYDNGGVFLDSEIQLRSAGEYLPGGYFGGYAARWQKLNAWPAWSTMEVIQLGARYIVRINGRTVTDHTAAAGAPAPYQLRLLTQPSFSYRFGGSNGFGSETGVDTTMPDEWGEFWFRNVRVYDCTSVNDPTCARLAAVNNGQAPKA